ncbi:hypothetical protein [Streptomyces sp. AK04-3B]|uniref:hypothetical protein n=1 Tax=Streptomyces sp. AK04-3B TaxID=3028650 RepID=UPI0029AB3C7C|nr:hypothetical protein [Streptomyces sp. AK04-3B]MDX3804777.1 hypothetical protein [Streptomyces sp. AK04-3B]
MLAAWPDVTAADAGERLGIHPRQRVLRSLRAQAVAALQGDAPAVSENDVAARFGDAMVTGGTALSVARAGVGEPSTAP